MSSEVNFSDVQGLVRFGYGWMEEAAYFLMRVKDAEAARFWLRAAPITSAVKHAFLALHRGAGRFHGAGSEGAWRIRFHNQRLFP